MPTPEPEATPLLRRATAEDPPAIVEQDGRAFGWPATDAEEEEFRALFDVERFWVATMPQDGRVVGVAGDLPFTMTLPGGAQLDVPGVTWVSVALDQRRRGVLTSLLRAQHRAFADAGAPLAVLTASEGGIYGRFGYGAATGEHTVEVDRRLVRMAAGAAGADQERPRHVDATAARAHAPGVHERWRAQVPGALSRSGPWWDLLLRDRPEHRQGASALMHLACPDGWACYRVERPSSGERRLRVVDLFAATDAAYGALWRALLSVDLVATTTARVAVDEPLPHLLTDPRQVRTTGVRDGMWVRLLDVAVALAARRYATEVDVVVEVADPFLDLGGRFWLRGGPDGADCTRTGRSANLRLPVSALGSTYLGGHRLSTLARAGLVDVLDPAALQRLDVAMGTARAPQHATDF